MACSLKSAKHGLFISLISFVACQISLALSLWYVFAVEGYSNVSSNTWTQLLTHFIIAFINVLIGYYGIKRENFRCIVVFALIMTTAFALHTFGLTREWYFQLHESSYNVFDNPSNRKHVLFFVNTGTAVVELISLIFACCLANQIRKKQKTDLLDN